jgi:hypothetical protein
LENETIYSKNPANGYPFITAENYLEAAGLITAMRAGISIESIRRPLEPTHFLVDKFAEGVR